MEITVNWDDLIDDFSSFESEFQEKVIKVGIFRLGEEMALHAKSVIETYVNPKGNQQGFDTGLFYNSITSLVILDGYGFELKDGVDYGVYHEFGTEPHFVYFFDRSGNITGLGEWALRHFSELGLEVVGKRGKKLKAPKRQDKESVLRNMVGMTVSLGEMAPFRKAIVFGKSKYMKIFKEAYDGLK